MAKHCSLENPENVKEFVANRKSSLGRKENLVDVYAKYAKTLGLSFSEPRYSREDTLPFIPLQKELESIIKGTRNLRQATVLRLLYETGMRVGEATRLLFKDFDFEKQTVRVVPEKGSRARELRISDKLCAMLKDVYTRFLRPLPNQKTVRTYLEKTRKILAKSEGNPRYLNIHLHTFRHFKATLLYHQTRDLLYVQQTLGHKSISNTLRYTQLVDWKDSEQFVCKVAQTLQEASVLIETGFDYVTEIDGVKLFRKRK